MSDAESGSGWELVEKTSSGEARSPALSIYSDGNARVNAKADRAFDRPPAAQVLIDPATQRLRLEPADPSEENAYSLARENEAGADVSLITPLTRLGVDIEQLEETHIVDVVGGDALIADISSLLEDELEDTALSDQNEEAEDETEDSKVKPESDPSEGELESQDDEIGPDLRAVAEHILDAYEPGEEWLSSDVAEHVDIRSQYAGRLQSELSDLSVGPNVEKVETDPGQASRWTLTDSGDEDNTPDESGDSFDEADDETDEEIEPTLNEVRTAAKDIDTIQELAEELDVSEGMGRRRAMDAMVYTDLQDDIRRPGVGD